MTSSLRRIANSARLPRESVTVEPVTVVIADDNSAYRARLAAAIASAAELELIGQFADGPSTLNGVDALRPNLAVLDAACRASAGVSHA